MLCTLAMVKTRLGIADGTQDNLLNQLIAMVSARFDIETDRKLERVVDNEEEFRADRLAVALEAAPVETVSNFYVRWKEGESWSEVTDVSYVLAGGKRVIGFESPLGSREQVAKIRYTGGYVPPDQVPGAGQKALPKELEHAAIEQVAQIYQLRAWSGVYRVEASAGTYLELAEREWVPWVRRILRRYRRAVMR